MVQFSDRVKVTSTSVGNGAITLSSSPVTGYQAVPSTLDGITVGYVIESGSAWEIGEGVYTHGTLQLSRTLRSSSTGSLLSLSSGTHTVFLSPASEDIKAPTITVTVAGGNFLIDGTANQTINLVPSIRYVFDLTAVGNSHPFRFASQVDGASSSQYTTGITVYQDGSNVQKHVEVQLEQDAPSTLYYYCTNHSGMGGTVNVGGGASYTHPNHSGEVTSVADGAMTIADGVVDEANLKVSNTPTDGYVLTARSGNTGGMTWEAASGGGSGTTIYDTLSAMIAAATPDEGTLHYNKQNDTLYVKAPSGFFAIATITNSSPTFDSNGISQTTDSSTTTIAANGSFELTAGSNTVVTVNASDVDVGQTLTYTATLQSGTQSDVLQSFTQGTGSNTNVFTLVPVTSGVGGTLTYRFSVTDSTNAITRDCSFEIAFTITDSKFTRLLMATDSSGDNNNIADTPPSGGSAKNIDVTDATNVIAGAFSPYAAEYSAYFDGASDYLSVPIPAFGSSDFSVSMWLYPTGYGSSNYTAIIDTRSGSDADTNGFAVFLDPNLKPYLTYNNNDYSTAGDPTLTMKQWNYLVLNYSSGNFTISVNGTTGSSDAISVNFTRTSAIIGRKYSSNQHLFVGSITDLAVKTSTSTVTPPTGRVSATGTQLLTCHLSYFKDGSSNDHTITVFGTPKIQRFSPYDFGEYDKTSNGGSILFKNYSGTSYLGNGNGTTAHLLIDKSSSSENSASTDLYLDANNWTVKGWIYVNVPMTSLQNLGIMHNYAASTNNSAVRYTGFGFSLRATSGSSGSYGSHVLRWTHGRGGSSNNENFSTTFAPYQWYYLEISNTAGTVSLKVNGKADSTTYSADGRPTGTWPLRLGSLGSGSYATQYEFEFAGFLADWQIVNGATAGESTVPTAPMSTHSNSKLHLKSVDAHVVDKVQVSNLQLFGSAASTSALSASSTPPRIGAAWDNTSAIKLLQSGSSDYIYAQNIDLSDEPFTIETWVYQTDQSGADVLFDFRPNGTSSGDYLNIFIEDGVPKLQAPTLTSSVTLSANTWHHLAVTKDTSSSTHVLRMYVDGTKVAQTNDNRTWLTGTDRPLIGAIAFNPGLSSYFLNGYIQDFRVTEGLARYTASDETANIPSAPLKG